MAIPSPITTDRINKSVNFFGKSLESLKNTLTKTTSILDKKNKNKRKFLNRNEILFGRILEATRKKEKREQQNASKPVNILSNPIQAIKNTGKGFLGRIMDFLGSLLLGWALNNLPTFIFMANEFIDRVGRVVSIGKAFVSDLGLGLKAFGNLIGAIGNNILRFDFFDSEGKVSSSINDLNNIFYDMRMQVDSGIEAVTTSLGVDLDTGELAPDFGTKYEAQPAPGEDGTIKGRSNEEKTLNFLLTSGLTPQQSAGVMANIKQESQFDPTADNGTHYGIAQWDKVERWPRVKSYIQSLGLDPNSIEGQLRGLIWEAKRRGDWQKIKEQQSSYGASEVWVRRFEVPGNIEQEVINRGRSAASFEQKYRNYVPQVESATPQATISGPPKPIQKFPITEGQSIKSSIASQGVGYVLIGDTRRYRSSGKWHNGIDIQAPNGTYIALRVDCEIIDYGNLNPTGYGKEIHVWIPQYSIRLKMAHLSGALITSGKVPAGKSFARVGSTGRSTGPHIHLEAGPRNQYKGNLDPSPYVSLLWLTDRPSAAWSTTATTTPQQNQRNFAQISQRQQSQQVAQVSQRPPSRVGSSIIMIQQPQQQIAQAPSSGGIIPIPVPIYSNTTNKFANQKILLELNYT